MSELQELDILVHPDGTVEVKVSGVIGKKCLGLTEGLVKVLGGNVILRTTTAEFDKEEQDTEQGNYLGQFG